MPANHKVSVAWQIVFTFLPIANFWAFYRIKKLRKYLLYVFAPSIALSAAYWAYFVSSQPRFTPWGDEGLAFGNPEAIFGVTILFYVISFAFQGFSIYLVIIWSRQHNKQFDQPTSQSAAPAA